MALLVGLGYDTATSWNSVRILAKLAKIAKDSTDDDAAKVDDENALTLLKELQNDPSIVNKLELTGSDDDDVLVDNKKKKKASTGAGEPSKSVAARKQARVDAFGCREGSQAATINAVLSDKPQSPDDIAKKAKLEVYRVRSHLQAMVGKKFVVRTDDGYKLAKAKTAAKPAKAE